jgi:hypothetical protein
LRLIASENGTAGKKVHAVHKLAIEDEITIASLRNIMKLVVPETNDPDVIQFARRLATDFYIRMPRSVSLPSYSDNHQVSFVEICVDENSEQLRCWFNCLRASATGKGNPVYGWAIWQETDTLGNKFFISQHHAVLRTEAGLIDITPPEKNLSALTHILFMPDERVPFDTENGRFPAALFWDPRTKKGVWGARKSANDTWDFLPEYQVVRIDEPNWKRFLPSNFS